MTAFCNIGTAGASLTNVPGTTRAMNSAASIAMVVAAAGTAIASSAVILWPNGNDWYYQAGTEPQAQQAVPFLVQAYKAAGFPYVILASGLPRTNWNASTHNQGEANRQALASAMRTSFSTWGADAFLDLTYDPIIGPDGAQNNVTTTAAGDAIHLNQVGYGYVSRLAWDLLARLGILPKVRIVVCEGDSYTAGTGAPVGLDYPTQCQMLTATEP